MTKLMERGAWVKKIFSQHICSIIAAYLQYIDWNEWNFNPPLYLGYFLTFYHTKFLKWVFLSNKMILMVFFYLNMPGALQQLVNCFLEASWGSLTFRHILVISSKISVCQDLKDSLGDRLYIILHSRVCWNSSSTASWWHPLEIIVDHL